MKIEPAWVTAIVAVAAIVFSAAGSYLGVRIALAELKQRTNVNADEIASLRQWQVQKAVPAIADNTARIQVLEVDVRDLREAKS